MMAMPTPRYKFYDFKLLTVNSIKKKRIKRTKVAKNSLKER